MTAWDAPIDCGPAAEDGAHFDVIVVGGGPGGSATAGFLSQAGHNVLLVEKGVWPRDKTCGDAVGGKSLSHVEMLGVKATLEATPHFRVDGILFSSPNGKEVLVPLPEEEVESREAGYALPREQFDTLLFRNTAELVKGAGGIVMQDFTVTEVLREGEARLTGVAGFVGGKRSGNPELKFTADLVVGAGGYNCPVAREIVALHDEPMVDKAHYCGGYREYWTGVKPPEGVSWDGDQGPIELHFIDEILPGYFWIFPLANGVANVGIGMVLTEMDQQSVKLRPLQNYAITEHPKFKERFADAKMVEGTAKGWQLPFGSPRDKPPSFQPRRVAMAGAACVGDAASLVDPFSGEGVGNALLSGKMVSDIFGERKAAHPGGGAELWDTTTSDTYHHTLWSTLEAELTNSLKLQRLVKKKRIMNFFISKAAKKPELQRALTDMIASKEAQGQFHSKWWMIKTLLF